MLVSGAVGSVIGSLCSGFLPQGLYNKLTGIILLLLALQMLISFLRKKHGKTAEQDSAQIKKANTIKAVCFGLLGGIMGVPVLNCAAIATTSTMLKTPSPASVSRFFVLSVSFI